MASSRPAEVGLVLQKLLVNKTGHAVKLTSGCCCREEHDGSCVSVFSKLKEKQSETAGMSFRCRNVLHVLTCRGPLARLLTPSCSYSVHKSASTCSSCYTEISTERDGSRSLSLRSAVLCTERRLSQQLVVFFCFLLSFQNIMSLVYTLISHLFIKSVS